MTGARKRKDCAHDGGATMRAAFMKALAVRVSDTRRRTRRRSSTITLPTGIADAGELKKVLIAIGRCKRNDERC